MLRRRERSRRRRKCRASASSAVWTTPRASTRGTRAIKRSTVKTGPTKYTVVSKRCTLQINLLLESVKDSAQIYQLYFKIPELPGSYETDQSAKIKLPIQNRISQLLFIFIHSSAWQVSVIQNI